MANQTEKRRGLARALVQKAAAFMDVQNQFEDLLQQYQSAGLTFVDADFDAIAGLQHLSAADTGNLLGSVEAVGKFIRGDLSANTGNHITNFEKARP